MIVIPTAELRGACLYAPSTHHGAASGAPVDPGATHRAFTALGFRQIHLYDVDGESGRGQNELLIAEIAREAAADILVSGGEASEDRLDRLFDIGVTQVIVHQGADVDAETLGRLADSYPGRLIIRADLGDPLFGRRSRPRHSPTDMLDFANELALLPLAGLAVHGVSSDGFEGTPLRFVEELVEASSVPVYCRTEAANLGELRALEHLGIAATLLGSSLFNGRLDAQAVVHHFDS